MLNAPSRRLHSFVALLHDDESKNDAVGIKNNPTPERQYNNMNTIYIFTQADSQYP